MANKGIGEEPDGGDELFDTKALVDKLANRLCWIPTEFGGIAISRIDFNLFLSTLSFEEKKAIQELKLVFKKPCREFEEWDDRIFAGVDPAVDRNKRVNDLYNGSCFESWPNVLTEAIRKTPHFHEAYVNLLKEDNGYGHGYSVEDCIYAFEHLVPWEMVRSDGNVKEVAAWDTAPSKNPPEDKQHPILSSFSFKGHFLVNNADPVLDLGNENRSRRWLAENRLTKHLKEIISARAAGVKMGGEWHLPDAQILNADTPNHAAEGNGAKATVEGTMSPVVETPQDLPRADVNPSQLLPPTRPEQAGPASSSHNPK